MLKNLRHKASLLPQSPGIYIYTNAIGEIIYIGKAINLKKRVLSYFRTKSIGPLTTKMMSEATNIHAISTSSEFEALILEANQIRKHKPKYNIQSKDDKSPIYITITDEYYPRILLTRKTFIDQGLAKKNIKLKKYFGPFPSAKQAMQLLKFLRMISPFCQQKIGQRACLYSQMGLCDPCPSDIEKHPAKNKAKLRKIYLSNIRQINSILSGRLPKVTKALSQQMKAHSKSQDYETAHKIKKQLQNILYATSNPISADTFEQNPNILSDVQKTELKDLQKILMQKTGKKINLPKRIECYDVAHLAGSYQTASMVTLIKGLPDKSFYRHFRIRSKTHSDDLASMKEVLERRSKYFSSWGYPDLILVDGGRGQVQKALEVLNKYNIPVVGIEKKTESLVYKDKEGFKRFTLPQGPAIHLVQRARNEAHRFARRYHHKLISTNLFPPSS